MYAALLAHVGVFRVRLSPRTHRLDHAPLAGNDHVGDVRAHDRAEDRAVVDEGAAAAEDMRKAPGRGDEQHDEHRGDCRLAQSRAAQSFVEREPEHQTAKSDADRRPAR